MTSWASAWHFVNTHFRRTWAFLQGQTCPAKASGLPGICHSKHRNGDDDDLDPISIHFREAAGLNSDLETSTNESQCVKSSYQSLFKPLTKTLKTERLNLLSPIEWRELRTIEVKLPRKLLQSYITAFPVAWRRNCTAIALPIVELEKAEKPASSSQESNEVKGCSTAESVPSDDSENSSVDLSVSLSEASSSVECDSSNAQKSEERTRVYDPILDALEDFENLESESKDVRFESVFRKPIAQTNALLAQAYNQEAVSARNQGDKAKCLRMLKHAVSLNYHPAMFNLAVLLETGELEDEKLTAEQLYRSAAKLGNKQAAINLSVLKGKSYKPTSCNRSSKRKTVKHQPSNEINVMSSLNSGRFANQTLRELNSSSSVKLL